MAVEINTLKGKNMTKFLLICFGLLLPITCQADAKQKKLSQELQGVWQGAALQDDKSRWTIKITIRPDGYSIDYPSLNCGGMLELTKENADSLVFKETLTYGTDNCYNNGKTVLIKSPNNKIRYYWYFENNGKKAAFGELTRQQEVTGTPQQKLLK